MNHQGADPLEHRSPFYNAGSSSAEVNKTNKSIVGMSSMELAVRTDRIQDALNSKPQRGKKRRNLNDQERLELTRTRNREHAKCTR